MHVTAIIAAGGRGQRFGGAQPKQLLAVGGRPILERSVAAFLSHPAIDAVVVALPQALVDDPPPYLRSVAGLASDGSGKPLRIVAGGERRGAFRRDVLSDALELADDATDEAALAERAGHPVRLVDGEATNIKITTPDDLAIAGAIAEALRIADRGLRTGDTSAAD